MSTTYVKRRHGHKATFTKCVQYHGSIAYVFLDCVESISGRDSAVIDYDDFWEPCQNQIGHQVLRFHLPVEPEVWITTNGSYRA